MLPPFPQGPTVGNSSLHVTSQGSLLWPSQKLRLSGDFSLGGV